MRKFSGIAAMGLLSLLSSSVWAVQGNLQSSSGFVASTVGGATVAQFTNEFDAAIDNPALMQFTKTKPGTHRFSVGLEYASYPNSFAVDSGGVTNPYRKGKLDTAYIPFLGYFYNINERFKFGTGLFAVGGTGYDYSNSGYRGKGLYSAIGIPLALSYKVSDEFNVGIALNLNLTTLSSNNNGIKNATASAGTVAPAIGATYEFPHSVVLGADLTLGTTPKYKKLYYPVSATQGHDMKIGTPLQFSVGVGQNTKQYSIGFKYRLVDWKHTESYKQLDWQMQHTFSLGGQYFFSDKFIGRAGIYYVTSVFGETKNVNGNQVITFQGQPLNKFERDFANALMYSIPQWQYAIGVGYKFWEKSIFDFGVVLEPEASIRFTGTAAAVGGPYDIRKKNSNLQIFLTYSQEV